MTAVTTPMPAEAPAADRTPTDPDVLYSQATRVRRLEMRRSELLAKLEDLGRQMGAVDSELSIAQMSLRQLLNDVDVESTAPWGVVE